jgi:hypothetical protein
LVVRRDELRAAPARRRRRVNEAVRRVRGDVQAREAGDHFALKGEALAEADFALADGLEVEVPLARPKPVVHGAAAELKRGARPVEMVLVAPETVLQTVVALAGLPRSAVLGLAADPRVGRVAIAGEGAV